MKYVDLRLGLPDELLHPMQAFVRDEDVVEHDELVAWNLAGEGVEYELFYVEAEREPYEAKLRTVDSVVDYRISEVDDGAFYVYATNETREEDVRWRRAFAALDLVVVPPVVFDDDGGVRMTVVGASEDVQAMLDSLPEAVDVTVEEIGTYERRRGLAGGLTDRQRRAVETALELGYYELPREAELADVASRLDCAESTASELLRRAEAAALSAVVDRYRPR